MSIRSPSVWLRFNGSSATSFIDAASGNTFTSGNQVVAGTTAPTSDGNGGFAVVLATPLPLCPVQAVQIQHFNSHAVTVSQPLTFFIASGTAPNFTIVDSWTVTMPPNVGTQVFSAGVDWTGTHTATAGEFIGIWTSNSPASNVVSGNGPSTNGNYYLAANTSLPVGSNTYAFSSAAVQYVNVYCTNGAGISVQQPGFDLTQKNNFSVSFPYNSAVFAPNGSLGDYDWNQPHAIYTHIDRAEIDRLAQGTVALASKGDYANGNGWILDLEPDATGSPLSYTVCYREHGLAGTSPAVIQSVCTGANNNMAADGVGLDILLSDAGTGWIRDNILYVNGANGGAGASAAAYNSQFNVGFNYVNLSVSGGTGYPASTAVTFTGGGATGVLNASMLSSGGVPTGFQVTQDSGFTSSPTCGLAASSGTGAVVTCTLVPSTLSNTAPLVVGSPYYGTSTDSAQGVINRDEFAMFPSALGDVGAANIFYETNWYQQLLGAPPANPPLVIFDDDGQSDPDNQYAFAAAIALDLRGYIRLIGVVNDDPVGACPALWRQMLDQAGLNQIPIAVTHSFAAGGTGCNSGGTELSTFNASTPTASSAYIPAVTLYRTLLAKYSTTPVQIFLSGDFSGFTPFMQSAADGISPLTGAQLLAQDATNGGQGWAQAVGFYCAPTSVPAPTPCSGSRSDSTASYDYADLQYAVANNASFVFNFIQGFPLQTGQGIAQSRTSKDPMFLFSTIWGTRSGFDTLAFFPIVMNQFYDSITVTESGGTGYANFTPIDQTGGGTNCPTQLGWLHATGGVPDLVTFEGGLDSNTTYNGAYLGLAGGCTSLPTLSLPGATGTGVTLTPYLNNFCGTVSVTIVGGTGTINSTSSSCSHHNFLIGNQNSIPTGEAPWFAWLANALMNPPPVGQPRVSF